MPSVSSRPCSPPRTFAISSGTMRWRQLSVSICPAMAMGWELLTRAGSTTSNRRSTEPRCTVLLPIFSKTSANRPLAGPLSGNPSPQPTENLGFLVPRQTEPRGRGQRPGRLSRPQPGDYGRRPDVVGNACGYVGADRLELPPRPGPTGGAAHSRTRQCQNTARQ